MTGLERRRWLVLVPHPDDETLGTGALIAQSARAGRLAAIVYLTDGRGSHPGGGARLAGVRRREAGHAIRRLGAGGVPVLRCGWPDARPFAQGTPGFVRTRDRLAALARRLRVDAIATTAAHEPHCDHEAAHAIAAAVCRRGHPTLFEYLVWGAAFPTTVRRDRTAAIPAGVRRAALHAHRSQLSPAFGDGFRLPRERRRMPSRDTVYRRRHG